MYCAEPERGRVIVRFSVEPVTWNAAVRPLPLVEAQRRARGGHAATRKAEWGRVGRKRGGRLCPRTGQRTIESAHACRERQP